jgi:hypothetical protein
MKLYNPFKAHIVQSGDKYFVRRLDFPSWVYKEKYSLSFQNATKKPRWWFIWEYVTKYCDCSSLEEARTLRDKKWIDPNKTPKVKVIHG